MLCFFIFFFEGILSISSDLLNHSYKAVNINICDGGGKTLVVARFAAYKVVPT